MTLNSDNRRLSRGIDLSWERGDIERRLGFPAGRFTDAGLLPALLIGVAYAALFYVLLIVAGKVWPASRSLGDMFLARGSIPYLETFFCGWALGILTVKRLKLSLQRRALEVEVVPAGTGFVLSPDTVAVPLEAIERAVDQPKRFVLFARIVMVLSNLRNMGRISDVDEMLAKQADIADDLMESSYGLLKGFIWAIPVLGFIGTVMGLSEAIGAFGAVLSEGQGFGELKEGLQSVTSGLAVAFDTTFVGLVQALIVQLLMIAEKKKEERFLDECREYCHLNIVARLRILPLENEAAGGRA